MDRDSAKLEIAASGQWILLDLVERRFVLPDPFGGRLILEGEPIAHFAGGGAFDIGIAEGEGDDRKGGQHLQRQSRELGRLAQSAYDRDEEDAEAGDDQHRSGVEQEQDQ